MFKKTLIGLLFLGILTILAFSLIIANFNIFDEPAETTLKTACDQKGLRKIVMAKSPGNATVNEAIHIYVTACAQDKSTPEPELIFTASSGSIQPGDVSFVWNGFDSVIVKFDKRLEVLKQKEVTESFDSRIVFKYIVDSFNW